MNDALHLKMLTLSRLYVKCNQPDEVIKYIQDIAKLKRDDLTIEEVNILFGAIHELVKKTKKQWEIICAIESKETKKNTKFKKLARMARDSVYKEMEDYIIIGNGLIDRYLIKNAHTFELEALFNMHRGDLERITITITPTKNDKEILDLKNKADKFYQKALELCKEVDNLSSIKAGIVLHYSMFLYEENKDVSAAYKIAKEFYDNSNDFLKRIKSKTSTFLELQRILGILKQNIDVWEKKKNSISANENNNKENIENKENN